MMRGQQVRWRIGGLLGVGVLINYFDRISLSVAAPELQQTFGLTAPDLGILFSAFFWSYAILQIPSGLLLDRFGVTRVGRWSAFLWVLASTLTACASGYAGILLARLVLGVAEAPSFPANAKATGYWFPRRERAMSTAIFDTAAKFSNVIGVPMIALAVVHWGWRWGFGVSAAFSLLYFVVFWLMYRDPSQHPSLTAGEREYITTHGAVPEGQSSTNPVSMLGYLLTTRKVWGLSLGFATYGYCFYLFLTWLPNYLVQTMHTSILGSAGLAAVPWACASVADMAIGGWLVDHLVSRGYNDTRVRKTVLLLGMCGGLTVLGAMQTRDPVIATVWISMALSSLSAAAPVGWSLPALIAPRGGAGTVGAIMNFANNTMGMAAPLITGYIVGRTHSFEGAFLVAGLALLAGIASFVFLLGPIEALPEPPPDPKNR